MASSYLPRSVRRYRAKNPYSYVLLFNFLDVLVGLLKIVAVLLILAGAWKAFLLWGDARSVDNLVKEDLTTPQLVGSSPALKTGTVEAAGENFSDESGVMLTESKQSALPVTGLTDPSVFDEAWLMSLSRDKFTVQLGTSPELDKLVDFAREVFGAEQAHIFPFRVSSIGNPIYGLVFGEHVDLQAAQQAVARFPAAYRQYDPWIRPVGQLQDQVQATREKLGL